MADGSSRLASVFEDFAIIKQEIFIRVIAFFVLAVKLSKQVLCRHALRLNWQKCF